MKNVKNAEMVIFDFDGTLVSKDTGYEFNKWLIKKSVLRTAFLFFLSPVILLLTLSSWTRKLGFNIAYFIGTAFQSKSLFYLRGKFIDHYFNHLGGIAYIEGLQELKNHQNNGRSVIIISGSPRWLLYGFAKHVGIKQATLIGSELIVKNKALFFHQHCYGENKLTMAESFGLEPHGWVAGYSDSKADIPMLQMCAHKVLINVPEKKLNSFKKHLKGPIETRLWIG